MKSKESMSSGGEPSVWDESLTPEEREGSIEKKKVQITGASEIESAGPWRELRQKLLPGETPSQARRYESGSPQVLSLGPEGVLGKLGLSLSAGRTHSKEAARYPASGALEGSMTQTWQPQTLFCLGGTGLPKIQSFLLKNFF